MIQKKMLFAVIGLSAFSLLAATRDPMDVPVKTVDELIPAIRDAVAGDRILIAPGTYDLTGQQMAMSGGSAMKSHLNVTKVCSFIGQGAKPEDTVLKADGDSHRVMMINASSGSVVSNLTFKNGYTGDIGGGVLIYAGATEFIKCRFIGNIGQSGGGIYSKVAGTVMRNCWFEQNGVLDSGSGGGAYACDTENCVFTNNSASIGGGACAGVHRASKFLCNVANPTVSVAGKGGGGLSGGSAIDCDFICNTNAVSLSHGAAVHKTVAVTNCLFRGNYGVSNGIVGGVLSVVDCTFEGNGGGAAIVRRSEVGGGEMCGCVFRHNTGCLVESQNATPPIRRQVYNCLFEANTNSGAVSIYTDFKNCTFVNNVCGKEKVAPLSGNATAVNCAFAGNLPQDIYSNTGAIPLMTNCLWITQDSYAEDPNKRIAAMCYNSHRVDDMKFKDPANGDYSPKGIRSPLYNAGYEDDGYLAAVGKTDCAGGERRKFDKIDIGAFELQEKQGLTILLR